MADDLTMMWDEVADMGALLHELADEQLDTPSLCEGWAVRDVLGHMAVGHTTPLGAMTARIARYGFNVTKGSFHESRKMFAGKSADEVRRFWDDVMIGQHPMKGISKVIPAKAGFLDHVVHNQDMRRPTGKPRVIPEDRLRRALDLAHSVGNPMFNPKKATRGLRLVATDIEWSAGDGPEVKGPGEALLLAAGGRKAALADLGGDGLATLEGRIGA